MEASLASPEMQNGEPDASSPRGARSLCVEVRTRHVSNSLPLEIDLKLPDFVDRPSHIQSREANKLLRELLVAFVEIAAYAGRPGKAS
jgi:hypothetical protein